MRHQSVIEISVQRLSCTACGAEANASCNCGKPYVPAKQRALEKARENPKQSVRALAEEADVSHGMAQRALEEARSTVPIDTVDGLDGKVRRLPVRQEEPDDEDTIESNIDPDSRRTAFMLRADQAAEFAAYSGPVDNDVYVLARRAAAAWQALALSLQQQLTKGSRNDNQDRH